MICASPANTDSDLPRSSCSPSAALGFLDVLSVKFQIQPDHFGIFGMRDDQGDPDDLNPQNPAKAREILGPSLGAGANFLRPETRWRGQSVANSSLGANP